MRIVFFLDVRIHDFLDIKFRDFYMKLWIWQNTDKPVNPRADVIGTALDRRRQPSLLF